MCFCVLAYSFFNIPAYNLHAESDSSVYEDYGLFAAWFIASDKYENEDSGWDRNTRIQSVNEIYDINNNLIGYTFKLTKQGVKNGYIFVQNTGGDLSVTEFSYTDDPVYQISGLEDADKIYYASPIEYYLESDNKLYTLEAEIAPDSIVAKNLLRTASPPEINPELSAQLRSFGSLNKWMADGEKNGSNGISAFSTVEIPDVYQYIVDTYGSGWTMKTQKTLSITARLQSSFESNVENCTLSSLTQAFSYFRSSYSNIPSNITTLYNDIKTIATNHGYTSSGGTPPTKIDDIITDIWKKYNYSNGKGNNVYVISFSIFKTEIDNNRPALFNMANGYYTNHTVLVKGYRTYEKSGILNGDKNFLRLNDNWSTSDRWIDYSAWYCCGSVSRFNTP